jgi:pimeloyl-ACP methyl ester carboxylesterase/tellurite resistance protein
MENNLMNSSSHTKFVQSLFPWTSHALEYWIDRTQRNVLFWDVLRKRGNVFFDHYTAGQPPVLAFNYEMVTDGRTFDQPVNYALVRILERRSPRNDDLQNGYEDRRRTHKGKTLEPDGRPSRPIVVIDPRAGHGPGIGGSKLNSQIGMAVDYGHPVYFILFYTDPEPGQTIADVQQAEIQFLEDVANRHPDAPKPAVIGNCQAGWATALIGADRPDVTGPMVLTGSPLSYWGGVEGANPMRYKGGLLGGVWLTSLWCDLGDGLFDGAHLVYGFEDLNPSNTYWTKFYHLYANIDTEEQRFLDFEKWWGGFFKMNAEEIHFIVDSLFIGNELEQGNFKLDDGRVINLKNFKDPILVFASVGDNITPPPQALNWIKKVYGTVDEIKRCGQVIIYMVHKKIGHLGIFVSAKIAKKEHNQILGNIGWLEYLSPGLYEMEVKTNRRQKDADDYTVRFYDRDMEDLLALDDGLEDEQAFIPVDGISKINDQIYRSLISPWIQLAVTPLSAHAIRQLHPLRTTRYMISDRNPMCWPVKWTADMIKSQRCTTAQDNPFVVIEDCASESIKVGLNYFRDMRDLYQELWFKSIYGNPWMTFLFGPDTEIAKQAKAKLRKHKKKLKNEKKRLIKAADQGSFVEASVRIMLAVAGADSIMDTREFQVAESIVQTDTQLRNITPDQFKEIIKTQSRIISQTPEEALTGLAAMLPGAEDRRQAYKFGEQIAMADDKLDKREAAVLANIRRVLKLDAP